MVGQTISHYRIIEALGGGGMGVVYKAIDLRLNRFVALKFLSPDLTRNAEANERFRHEAQAASALDHPNICTIHEIDETGDRELFLTMAYYDGETLKQRIERGGLSVEEALGIAIQIAQALARAHESGIVHRDVKPANLMIAKDGLVKILDFGLAKLLGRSDLTRTGTTLGTVAYMSPEQIRGGEVEAGTDVWSLGVVLYEMLAGRRPFDGQNDLAVVSVILNEAPTPIDERREGIPRALRHIVARALDKNVTSRYQSATELARDLTACRDGMAGSNGRASIWRTLRRPVVAIAAVVILLVAGFRPPWRTGGPPAHAGRAKRRFHKLPASSKQTTTPARSRWPPMSSACCRTIRCSPVCGRSFQSRPRWSPSLTAPTSSRSPTPPPMRTGSIWDERLSTRFGCRAERFASGSKKRASSRS